MPRHACRIATVAHLGSDSPELRKFSHARHSPRAAKYGSRVISFKLLLFASGGCQIEELQTVGRLRVQQRSRCQLCERTTQTFWQPLVDLTSHVTVSAALLLLRAAGDRFGVTAHG